MMLVLVLAAGLAASAPQDEERVCRAGPAEMLVGERYRRHLPSRAKRLADARVVRVIMPGEMMTMDFRPDRVTLRVDHRRRVTAVTCG